MPRISRRLLVCMLALITTLVCSASRHAAAAPPPTSPQGKLEQFVIEEKIESGEQAISFFSKMVDAGCSEQQAYRWTRMALYADKYWNLAELAGIIEMQLLEGATRQVVEREIEKRIKARATEMDVQLSGFDASLAAEAQSAPAKTRRKKGKARSKTRTKTRSAR